MDKADLKTDIDDGFTPHEECRVPPITWNTRRRMALISLWSFVVGSAVALIFGAIPFPDRNLQLIETIYMYFTIGHMTVIAAYMGTTVAPFIGAGRRG